MNDARLAFGPTLRTHRERHGITLSDIAQSTKISLALLESLERSDLSRWPKGIFRRAFFREYVVAIGLSPDPLLAEFARLFPDDSQAPAKPDAGTEFRLELAENHASTLGALKRLAVVAGELTTVVLLGTAVGWVLNVGLWSACGVIALAYYPIANILFERRLVHIRQPLGDWLRARLHAPPRPSTLRSYDEIEAHEELQASF